MKGVLNETTMTVHRHEMGASDLQTRCGHTYHVEHDRLKMVAVERANDELSASKCGQCFEEGGGY